MLAEASTQYLPPFLLLSFWGELGTPTIMLQEHDHDIQQQHACLGPLSKYSIFTWRVGPATMLIDVDWCWLMLIEYLPHDEADPFRLSQKCAYFPHLGALVPDLPVVSQVVRDAAAEILEGLDLTHEELMLRSDLVGIWCRWSR